MKWIVQNSSELKAAMSVISQMDINCAYKLEIKKIRGKRSLSQNSLIWVWCTFVEKETGQDRDDVYYEMQDRFAPLKESTRSDGTIVMVKKRISELDPVEFGDLLDMMKAFFGSMGIELVWPDDYRFNIFHEEVL